MLQCVFIEFQSVLQYLIFSIFELILGAAGHFEGNNFSEWSQSHRASPYSQVSLYFYRKFSYEKNLSTL